MTRPCRPFLLARAWLAGAAVCALASCYDDRPSPGVWVPFETITGSLRPELANTGAGPAPPAGALRIVTYNVHLGEDYAGVEAAFRNDPALQGAGVLLLEEIESHPSDGQSQAARLAAALSMSHAYAPAWAYADGSTHGLAVLSRWPILAADVLDLPYFDLGLDSERRIALGVTLAIGDQAVRVIAVHLDTRIDPNDRLKQLLPAVELSGDASILGGDLNSSPYLFFWRVIPMGPTEAAAPVDVAGAVDDVMRSRGFSAPTAESGDTTRLIVNARLDSIYLRGYTAVGSGVARDVSASDHLPVWVDVTWPPAS